MSALEKITRDPLETGFRKFLKWANDKSAVEQVDDDFTIESKLVPEFDIPYSVLRLAGDAFYCSDFIRMAAILQETEEFKPGMADIYSFPDKVQSYTPAITDKELGCADEMDDGTSWAEAWLAIPPLQHINVCYALHALATHQSWSIPDILRINDFKIEVQLTNQQFSDQERNRLQW